MTSAKNLVRVIHYEAFDEPRFIGETEYAGYLSFEIKNKMISKRGNCFVERKQLTPDLTPNLDAIDLYGVLRDDLHSDILFNLEFLQKMEKIPKQFSFKRPPVRDFSPGLFGSGFDERLKVHDGDGEELQLHDYNTFGLLSGTFESSVSPEALFFLDCLKTGVKGCEANSLAFSLNWFLFKTCHLYFAGRHLNESTVYNIGILLGMMNTKHQLESDASYGQRTKKSLVAAQAALPEKLQEIKEQKLDLLCELWREVLHEVGPDIARSDKMASEEIYLKLRDMKHPPNAMLVKKTGSIFSSETIRKHLRELRLANRIGR